MGEGASATPASAEGALDWDPEASAALGGACLSFRG